MNTQRTASFLMANLGSELIRFVALLKHGNQERILLSAERARGIIDELLAREDIGSGKQEVLLLRSIIEDALSKHPQYRISESELNSYFFPFAQRVLSQ